MCILLNSSVKKVNPFNVQSTPNLLAWIITIEFFQLYLSKRTAMISPISDDETSASSHVHRLLKR